MKGNKNCGLKHKYVFLEIGAALMHLYSVLPTNRPISDTHSTPTTGFKEPVRDIGATKL